MVMWLTCAARSTTSAKEVYHFIVPASNTAVGHIILENGVKPAATKKPAARKPAASKAAPNEERLRRQGKPMKICVAGQGAFGQKHLDALKRIPGVEIVSLIGGNPNWTEQSTRNTASPIGAAIWGRHARTDAVILPPPQPRCTSARASR